MVELKDDKGRLIRKGLVNYRDVYHLAKVTVVGMLREEEGNYFLDARLIHVDKETPLDIAKSEKEKAGN